MILFIVESPHKIKKISQILDNKYVIKASVGHIRDLQNNKMSIDFDNNFRPIYVIKEDKQKIVNELKAAAKNASSIYIATDRDLEGEAIAQHIYDVLKPKSYKRIVFNEISKTAIINAIENAGVINANVVEAQTTRRLLDRIYGYTISPIVNNNVNNAKSAGRVQSVAVRIIVDQERKIEDFMKTNATNSYYKTIAMLSGLKCSLMMTKSPNAVTYDGNVVHIESDDIVKSFLNVCIKSKFIVRGITETIGLEHAPPPFETSTLQQDANRRFGLPIEIVMKTAQKLYEAGFITYIRTDSVALSEDAHVTIKKVVTELFGLSYYQNTKHKTTAAGAQEAHEAIRPTDCSMQQLPSEITDKTQRKVYKLIWQRTIASQMKPAKIKSIIIQIDISKYIEKKIKPFYYFQSQINKVEWLGYKKVYQESTEDIDESNIDEDFNGKLPSTNSQLSMQSIKCTQEYKKPPVRYSEASMVNKIKKLGIGRPSTYVSTIKNILDKRYVMITNVPGIKKDSMVYSIDNTTNDISQTKTIITIGQENKKLVPTKAGISVTDYMLATFAELVDYDFTAKLETQLDKICDGKKTKFDVLSPFYKKIMDIVKNIPKTTNTNNSDILIGLDQNNNEIYCIKIKGSNLLKKEIDGKSYYQEIADNIDPQTISIKQAIKMFTYPKLLGTHENMSVLLCLNNKLGQAAYIKHGDKTYSAPSTDIKLIDAIEIIKQAMSKIINQMQFIHKRKKMIVKIINGPHGPYINLYSDKVYKNFPIKNIDPKKITQQEIIDIIQAKYSDKTKLAKTNTGAKPNAKTNNMTTATKSNAKTNSTVAKPNAKTNSTTSRSNAKTNTVAKPKTSAKSTATKSNAKTSEKPTAKKPVVKTTNVKPTAKKSVAKTTNAKPTAKKPAVKTTNAKTSEKSSAKRSTTKSTNKIS